MSESGGALAGVRVVDLASVVMGPCATQILGDLGVDVVKVESPGGDMVRRTLPQQRRPRPQVPRGPCRLPRDRRRGGGLLDVAEHPTEGAYRSVGFPVRLSETPGGLRTPCPVLGQDTAAVLRELGRTDDEIAAMAAAGTAVVTGAPAPTPTPGESA